MMMRYALYSSFRFYSGFFVEAVHRSIYHNSYLECDYYIKKWLAGPWGVCVCGGGGGGVLDLSLGREVPPGS